MWSLVSKIDIKSNECTDPLIPPIHTVIVYPLQARQPGGADLYICYAGVQLREAVAAEANWLVFNFRDLIDSLE